MHVRFVDILTILQKEILGMESTLEPGSKISQAIGYARCAAHQRTCSRK